MAKPSYISFAVLLLLSLVFAIEANNNNGATYLPAGREGSLRPTQCGAACNYRCSKTHHRNACLEFCNLCCRKCLCVPSGTYGNKEECPCYNNWKTKEGGPKCP